jgi:predicted enzyme related to lactoylglutathione lyase
MQLGGQRRSLTGTAAGWPRVTAAVERLIAAGATMIREDVQDGTPDHVVMTDPEGNEFCVL